MLPVLLATAATLSVVTVAAIHAKQTLIDDACRQTGGYF